MLSRQDIVVHQGQGQSALEMEVLKVKVIFEGQMVWVYACLAEEILGVGPEMELRFWSIQYWKTFCWTGRWGLEEGKKFDVQVKCNEVKDIQRFTYFIL